MEISETTRDDLSTRLEGMIRALPPVPFTVNYDLHCGIPSLNDKPVLAPAVGGFTLKMMSIGPFYHGEGHLQNMEYCKLRYLKLLLNRLRQSSVGEFVTAMRSLEKKARIFYREKPVDLSSDQFVEILVVDGVFIVEFLRKLHSPQLRESHDPIFSPNRWDFNKLIYDLLFYNNQIPFFVINQLFTMTKDDDCEDDASIVDLVKYLAESVYPWSRRPQWNTENVTVDDNDHLLAVVHRILCSSFTEEEKMNEKMRMVGIKSVSRLQEAGIKFVNNTEVNNGLKIQFTDGVMKIPSIRISGETRDILTNLILYERHCTSKLDCRYVTEYIFVLKHLADSSKDVKILRHHGIVVNFMGYDKFVVHMFHNLCAITKIPEYLCHAEVYSKLDEYCVPSRRMAILRNYYCCSIH